MVFRVQKTKDYTTMSNYHLRDKNLSLKAKGLLSWMLSNNNDWDYSIAGIVACCKEGETTVNTALRELQEYGYVKIIKVKPNKDNNRIHYEYNVYERPQDIDSQDIESQVLESQDIENQVQRNTNIINTNKRNTNNKTITINSNSTNFSFGTKKEKPKKESMYSKCVSLIADFTDDSILRELLVSSLNLFLENSRESDKPFYTNHFKGKLNDLKKLSEDNYEQRKIVQQTLDKGWNGFYAVKTDAIKKKTASTDLGYTSNRAKRGDNSGEKF